MLGCVAEIHNFSLPRILCHAVNSDKYVDHTNVVVSVGENQSGLRNRREIEDDTRALRLIVKSISAVRSHASFHSYFILTQAFRCFMITSFALYNI